MAWGYAAVVTEAVFAAKAAARLADGALQAGAAWKPKPDRAGADRIGIVAYDSQRRCANSRRNMHRPCIHTHHSLGFAAGSCQLNQVGATAKIDKGARVVGQKLVFTVTGVVIKPLPSGRCPHKTNRYGAAAAPLKHLVPGMEGPDFGGSGGGGMDQKWRNIKVWFLPGQLELGEIGSTGFEEGHPAEQLCDVVAREMPGVAGEKGW